MTVGKRISRRELGLKGSPEENFQTISRETQRSRTENFQTRSRDSTGVEPRTSKQEVERLKGVDREEQRDGREWVEGSR